MPNFPTGGLAPASTTLTEAERLTQAEATVRDFCRWHIAPEQSDAIEVEGSELRVQVLPTRMLVSVADVTLDGVDLTEGTHFRVDPMGVLERIDGGRFVGRLALTMLHGWDTPPLPVQAIIIDMARSGATDHVVGAATVGAGPVTFTYGPDSHVTQAGTVGLSTEQKRILAQYALEPDFA